MITVDKSQILCVVLGIVLFIGVRFVDNTASVLEDGNQIERNTYGQGEKDQELTVEGLLGKKLPLDLRIGERQYGEKEAEAAFDPAYEVLISGILGENEALSQVRTKLNLPSWVEEYGMTAEWRSENQELLDTSGEVFNENCPEQGVENTLTLTLKAGPYSREYAVETRIFPPVRSEEEKRIAAFQALIRSLDEQQKAEGQLTLPEEFEGRPLTYEAENGGDSYIFLILGAVAAVLIPLRERQNEAEQKKKRERQLMLDYSEIVSKLVVFMGAGLPVRKAWERIVRDYEEKQEENGSRYAYEEMENAYYLMGRGVPETQAYVEFGNRCRLLPYRKLAGILETNVKNGTENLRVILETEMADAFEQRKTLARRMGEEAGTKLLLPLFMMLAVVMVIVSVPAFLSFGI